MDLKTLTIVLTDGPYISEQAEMAYKIARAASKHYRVNVFLYLDGVHIPKVGQRPTIFANIGDLFLELAREGATIRCCMRCATARGYRAGEDQSCKDYPEDIKISSIYELANMLKTSDKVISLSR
ncbi:MAG TPA: DsrE family protein [Methanotrichaceae archaeon]|nr:DsrE family protein [Methanotrichaceae archaeon]